MAMANTILDMKLLSFQNELLHRIDLFKPRDKDIANSISQNIRLKLRQFEKIKADMDHLKATQRTGSPGRGECILLQGKL